MSQLFLTRPKLGEALAWLAFYLTVHFNLNDEHLSFWLPMKFLVAVPQTLFSMIAVYSFGWLFARPLDTPMWKLLLYGLGAFLLVHVVYYYALRTAQPWAPADSVTHRRWCGFMAEQGPFYFLRNGHYLLTVSPFFFFSLVCLPLAVKLLHDGRQEQRQLAAAQQRWQIWEATSLRTRLNPAFFQQTLEQITNLLHERQAPTAAEVTLKLAQVLRHTLYATHNGYVPLQPELDAFLDYVQLQELRLEHLDITLRLTVEDAAPHTLAAGILLPLTEHWLTLSREACEIEMRVRDHQLTLRLRAEAVAAPTPLVVPHVEQLLRRYYSTAYVLNATRQGTAAELLLELPLDRLVEPRSAPVIPTP